MNSEIIIEGVDLASSRETTKVILLRNNLMPKMLMYY